MNRIRIRADDERFARLLDGSPSVALDPAMGSLVLVANALRSAGHATGPAAPDPAFRAALRQRLVAVATVQAAGPAGALDAGYAVTRPTVSHRAQRRLAAFAGTVAIVTSVAGVGVAAARSLPGDPFYGIKRATEGVQLWTAHGQLAKGKRHLEFARTRLAEAEALPTNSSHLASTIAAMNVQTTDGSRDLIASYQSSKSLVPLADLLTFTKEQIAGLQSLAATLPVASRGQELKSIQLLGGLVNQVDSVSGGTCVLCALSGGAPSPSSHHTTPPTRSLLTPSARPSSSGGTSLPVTTPTPGVPIVVLPTPTSTRVFPTSPGVPPTSARVILPLPSLSPTLPAVPLHHHKQPLPVPLPSVPLPVISTLLPGGL
jgi:hypothetical protein